MRHEDDLDNDLDLGLDNDLDHEGNDLDHEGNDLDHEGIDLDHKLGIVLEEPELLQVDQQLGQGDSVLVEL